jgi:hypothetical protein
MRRTACAAASERPEMVKKYNAMHSPHSFEVFEDEGESEQDFDSAVRQSTVYEGISVWHGNHRRTCAAESINDDHHPCGNKSEVLLILMRASRAKADANFFLYSSLEIQRNLDRIRIDDKWIRGGKLQLALEASAQETMSGSSLNTPTIQSIYQKNEEVNLKLQNSYMLPESLAKSPLAQSLRRSCSAGKSGKDAAAHLWPSGAAQDARVNGSSFKTPVGAVGAQRRLDFRNRAAAAFMPFTTGTRSYVLRPSSAAGHCDTHGPSAGVLPPRPSSACAPREAATFAPRAGEQSPASRRPASAPPARQDAAHGFEPPPCSPYLSGAGSSISSCSIASSPSPCPSPSLSLSTKSAPAPPPPYADPHGSGSGGLPRTDVERRFEDRVRRLRAAGAATATQGGEEFLPWRPRHYRPLLARR